MVIDLFKIFFKKGKTDPSKIYKRILIGEIEIMLLRSTSKASVIAFDQYGKQIWSIKNKNYFDHKHKTFSNIYVRDNKLYLYHSSGVEVWVNPNTGEIIGEEFIK